MRNLLDAGVMGSGGEKRVETYNGIPITRTSKGNENWFEKSGVRNIGDKITVKQIQGKRLLV